MVAVALVLAGCLGLQAWSSVPAFAHAALVSSDPKDGAVLDRPPRRITLEFDDPISGKFDFVAVSGPDGATYQSGHPRVMGSKLTQRLARPGPAGTYQVAWRVVSADGHPVSGTLKFTTRTAGGGHGTPATTQPGKPGTPGTPGTRGDGSTATPGATGTPSASGRDDSSGTPWWPIGVAVLVVAGGGAVIAGRRRRDGDHGDPPSPDEG
ncbi:copper resistance CopC family protein [Actinopolymorpha sp. NPDC004070]|uniref:copper resistance CopC family protein n=1 Tax=Actinopolymorpha sp. NPDC004070 TaxID=3154548 RepID=UPI0033A504FF